MSGNSRWRMTSPQLAGVTFGLFVIMAIALAFSRSGCSSATPTEIVVDTVYTDTAAPPPAKQPKAKKTKKKKTKETPPLQQRNYRDDIVSKKQQ